MSAIPRLSNVPCCRWRGTPVSGARPAFPSPTTTRAPSECAPPPPPTRWCSRSPPPPPPPSHTTRRGSHYLATRDTVITLQINFSLSPCFSLSISARTVCCVPASSRKPQQSLLKFPRFQVGGGRAAGHRLHAIGPHRRARRHAQAGEGRLNHAAVGRDRDLELLLLMLLLKSSRIDSRFTLAARGWKTEQNCKLAAAARQL